MMIEKAGVGGCFNCSARGFVTGAPGLSPVEIKVKQNWCCAIEAKERSIKRSLNYQLKNEIKNKSGSSKENKGSNRKQV
jgi:hypothetical protein